MSTYNSADKGLSNSGPNDEQTDSNTPITDGIDEEPFTPPDAHYDFREGVEFRGSWPSKELVHHIHDTFVFIHSMTVVSEEETVKLSKSDILEFSIRSQRQTDKALLFLEAYDVLEYHRGGREVAYSYNPESAKNFEVFEAMGALNSIAVRDDYLRERREEAKEAYLQSVRSD